MSRWPCRQTGETGLHSPFARGFASFGATRESFNTFLGACRRIGLRCETFIASENPGLRPESGRGRRPVAVFQDLPASSPPIALLTQRVVFPAWFHGVPLCFFSRAERAEYPGKSPRSDSLHTDLDAVEAFLVREQLTRILEMCDSQTKSRFDAVTPRPADSPKAILLDPDLDPSQAAAAGHGSGPMRVLASAGSGKTKTLVNRVCNLVNRGVPPENILPLAFNRKAAAEMNTRLEGKGLARVQARTFHSLGYEIVRTGSPLAFDAGSESEQTRGLLKEAIESIDANLPLTEGESFERAMELLRSVKMDLLPLDRMTLNVSGESVPFRPMFRRYLEMQEERRFMNYDDMIYFAVRILLDNDPLRREYQKEFRFVLVDEFQDLNRAQILLLQILALPENNIFIVGDDDQMIYGWRGATVRSIIDFPRIHACARECALSTNYRSSVRIVVHAGWLINRNRDRVPKSIVPRGGAPRGDFEILLQTGLWEQAQSAAEWILMKKAAVPWRENSVLFRYNALQFIVALALDRKNIPHTKLEANRLFDSRAGRDVAAWLDVLLFPCSARREDLERVLRRPEKILRRSLLERLESWSDVEMLPGTGTLKDEEEETLREFLERVRAFRLRARLLAPCELIDELDRTLHLRRFYDRKGRSSSAPDEADDGTYLDVISAVSRTFPTAADFLAHVEASRNGLHASPFTSEPPPDRDEVLLSTIHRAKGNEFSRVVFFDMSRRHRPGRGETEDERRVAYVGLTRAKDSLLVTANGRRQSLFLREAALDPQFAGRMREDMESELVALRKRLRGLRSVSEEAASRKRIRICRDIDALEEELRCRAMLSLPPASP